MAEYLRLFSVTGYNVANQVTWKSDVVSKDGIQAVEIAARFCQENGIVVNRFFSTRARQLKEPYGWVIA